MAGATREVSRRMETMAAVNVQTTMTKKEAAEPPAGVTRLTPWCATVFHVSFQLTVQYIDELLD
jgi:hypothetical protein